MPSIYRGMCAFIITIAHYDNATKNGDTTEEKRIYRCSINNDIDVIYHGISEVDSFLSVSCYLLIV